MGGPGGTHPRCRTLRPQLHGGLLFEQPAHPVPSKPHVLQRETHIHTGCASYDGTTGEATAEWPETTGCDQLSFNPSLSAQPTTTETDSPSGLEVDLSVPQELSPTTPSPSEIRATTVTLPEGFSINPNAADGKTSCSDAEAHLGPFASTEEAQCPEYSKVGTASLDSSALPGPLPGSIYLG